ncbi:MAG: hypothetical protein PHT07_21515 [Paludibacter sp.]|nr:hypothetical protein [Paludibacter sp.]
MKQKKGIMDKLDFKDVFYDSGTVCWGCGNDAIGPRLVARIKMRDLTPEEEAREREDWLKAKDIYEKYINRGQLFRPAGKTGNKDIVCKITFINPPNQKVSWKQAITEENLKKMNYSKPAKGSFSINVMIRLYLNGEIEFIQ